MDKENKVLEEMSNQMEEGVDYIVFEDDNGNETYFIIEQIFPAGKNSYAVLVPFNPEAENPMESEEDDCVIAKVVFDENGDADYVDPTDAEFQEAIKAYEELDFADED